jgi:Kef-type K+ transport system membrane component KefB
MDPEVYEKIRDRFFALSYGFLAPVFFVSLSFHLHFEWSLQFIALVVAIFIVAVIGKLVGSGLGGLISGHNIRQSVILGFGMNGRGAVELVVAAVVVKLSNELMAKGAIGEPLLTQAQFSALVLMAFATTLLAPISLKWSVKKTCSSSENESFCELWESSAKK